MLILLDIDGTLLHGSPAAHTEAMARGMAEVYELPITAQDIVDIGPSGRTDQEIARVVLRGRGVDDAAITAGLAPWIAASVRAYHEVEDAFDPPRVAPGADRALERLSMAGGRLALLTGNLEPIGHAKMAQAGLGHWFRPGEGAFGSDHELRTALVPIALGRAGGRGPAVVVGDTPADIGCARAGGARCVAVASGPYGPDQLAEADAVAADMRAAGAILEEWLTRR